jgi:uncharacterized protein YjbI with pentapeptide repeats
MSTPLCSERFESVLTSREKGELAGEVFCNRELVDIDFSGSDLRGASFERSVLLRCSFAGADLRGARFLFCDLHSVDLGDALLGGNRFDGTTLVEPVGVSASVRHAIAGAGGAFQLDRASRR